MKHERTSRSHMELREKVQGTVVCPGDEGYEQARLVWNGMIDAYPACIVQCETESDVQEAVRYAREQNLQVSVRGGGHNVAGFATCDDGLVIDLGLMDRVRVDENNMVVSVQGGALWADVDKATTQHGLIVPGGVVSDTGVAGLTLNGGIGHFRRKFGMSCDNMIGARVVTANGDIVVADTTTNTDLLWALRGGGGNFGIVTEFIFRAYEAGPNVRVSAVFHPAENGITVMKWLRDHGHELPRDISVLTLYGIIPPNPPFPEPFHGRKFFATIAVHSDTGEKGEKELKPLRQISEPLFEIYDVLPWVEVQQFFDEEFPAHELRYYWKSQYIRELPDEALEVLQEQALKQPSRRSTTDVWQLGGAVREMDEIGSALSDRGPEFLLNVEANWEDAADDEANIQWARETLERMKPWLEDRSYLNFPGSLEEGNGHASTAYGGNYNRLAELKRRYDPENVFSLNTNIKPEVAA